MPILSFVKGGMNPVWKLLQPENFNFVQYMENRFSNI